MLTILECLVRIALIPEVIERVKSSIVQEATCDCSEKMPEPEVVASAEDSTITKNLQETVDTQKVRSNFSERHFKRYYLQG